MRRANVVFHPAAAQEYEAACDWYGKISGGLLSAFEREVDRAVRLIAAAPTRWPRYGHRHRKFFLRRFPYLIFYLKKRSRIWIVAVAHGRRRPDFWRLRLV